MTLDARWAIAQAANVPAVLTPEQFLVWRQDYNEGRFGEAYLKQYPQMFVNPTQLTGGLSQLDWFNYDQKTPATSVTEKQKAAMKEAGIDYVYQTVYELTHRCLVRLLGE